MFCFAGLYVVERRGRAEQLNAERQVEIAALLESVPEAVFLFDKTGHVIEVNELAEQLTGFSAQELKRMDDRVLSSRLTAQDESAVPITEANSVVTRALRGETVQQTKRVYRDHRDGRDIEALVSASPMRNQLSRETIGAMVVVRDITEVAQLQRRLADTQRHNAIGQMAAGIAHDFNNVLDTINQAVFLLDMQASRSPDERKVYSELIKKAVARGAEISERVREYLRTGTGERTQVDVRLLLDDVVEMTRPMWQVARKVHVRTHFGPVPNVCANAADMRRVFTNLIINALEAMPNGGMLMIGCESVGDRVRVQVEDTGQGIPPEQEKKMFVPYFTTKKTGTGLGLSGAQKIVTAAGGSISYRTQVGRGTCFTVDLPRSSSRPPRRVNQQDENSDDTSSEEARASVPAAA
jgi:PAS domain S-box-containing protein